jgi:hypothetical protein
MIKPNNTSEIRSQGSRTRLVDMTLPSGIGVGVDFVALRGGRAEPGRIHFNTKVESGILA